MNKSKKYQNTKNININHNQWNKIKYNELQWNEMDNLLYISINKLYDKIW